MIRIIKTDNSQLKPTDQGWRQSQSGQIAIGQAAAENGGMQPNVSDRDADIVANMMGDGIQEDSVQEQNTGDTVYPKCSFKSTLINPDKDTVAQMMIQKFIKQNGSIIMNKAEDKDQSGPKLILG